MRFGRGDGPGQSAFSRGKKHRFTGKLDRTRGRFHAVAEERDGASVLRLMRVVVQSPVGGRTERQQPQNPNQQGATQSHPA